MVDHNRHSDHNHFQSTNYNSSEHNTSSGHNIPSRHDIGHNSSHNGVHYSSGYETSIDDSTDDATIDIRPVTPEEKAYREGYTFGRNQEHFHEQIARKQRNDSTAAGVAIGVLLTTLVGMVLAVIYFGTRSEQIQPVPVPVPSQQQSSPTPVPSPGQPTIIDRSPSVSPVPENTEIIVPTTPSSPPSSTPVPPTSSQPNITQPTPVQPVPSVPQPPSQSDAFGVSPSQTLPDNSTDTGATQ